MPARPVCPGLQRTHVLFQAAGLVSNPFVAASFAACNAPASSPDAATEQHTQSAPPSRYGTGVHRRQPRRRVCGQLPEGFSDLSTSTPDAEEKRATLWLMDAIEPHRLLPP